jgi:hypothetical protein
MEPYKTTINGMDARIFVRIINKPEKPNFKAIANVNFGWFEAVGFRITQFSGNPKSGHDSPRREDGFEVQPPCYPQGQGKWVEAFRTTAAVKDKGDREQARRNYWYNLQDEVIEAYKYYLSGNIDNQVDNEYPNFAAEVEKLMEAEERNLK